MWGFFFVSVALVVAAVLYMLSTLPAYGVPFQVKVVTGYAWLTTLLICCIVPLDIYSTLRGVNPVAIDDLWDISYWSTQLLTWLLIPLYMGYADAGEFTWKGRMMASVRSNGLFLGLMAVAGAVGLAWAVTNSRLSLETLPSLGIALSNAFGLLCVLTLLGYGLVTIPRRLWRFADPEAELRLCLFRLGRLAEERLEAREGLVEAARKLASTRRALGNGEAEAHAAVERIAAFLQANAGTELADMSVQGGTSHQGLQYTDELPRLHGEIKRDVSWARAVAARSELTTRRACHLSRVVRASAPSSSAALRDPEGPSASLEAWPPGGAPALRRVLWRAEVKLRPWALRAAAIAAAALGSLAVWCELLAGFGARLSPLGALVRALVHHGHVVSQTAISLLLAYFIAATFVALFSINVGAIYALVPAATSSFSLLFVSTLAARFAAPLCFNFLHTLALDRPITDRDGAGGAGAVYETVFAQRMGFHSGDDVAIPFLGVSFSRIAPIVLLAVVALTLLNVFGAAYRWVAAVLVFLPPPFDEASADDATSEAAAYIADGQRIVARALAGGFAAAGDPGGHRGLTGAPRSDRGLFSSASSSATDMLNLASYAPSAEFAGSGLGGHAPAPGGGTAPKGPPGTSGLSTWFSSHAEPHGGVVGTQR